MTNPCPLIALRRVAAYPGTRALAWDGGILFGCRGYEVVRLDVRSLESDDVSQGQVRFNRADWQPVAAFRPAWWRNLTSRNRLTSRLVRDGFHAFALAGRSKAMVGAVPGAIVTRGSGDDEFRITHRIRRGTRPLHIAAAPSGDIFWGEYFDNRERAEVRIYVSKDSGESWQVAHTFPPRSIRHVHNIVYDRWRDCLWILTGDEGAECKIIRASCDLRSLDVAVEGNQQSRAVAAIPTADGLYFSTDTPFEKNHVYRLSPAGEIEAVGDLDSSSINGCQVEGAMFFSTMVEPSPVNFTREVNIVGSIDCKPWPVLAHWKKDIFPTRLFQYGNAFLPDGDNSTNYLAATTVAVEHADLVTTIWKVEA